MLVKYDLALANLFKELLLVVGLEGAMTVEHIVEKDAQGPKIGLYGAVGFPHNDLRRHVRRSSAVGCA